MTAKQKDTIYELIKRIGEYQPGCFYVELLEKGTYLLPNGDIGRASDVLSEMYWYNTRESAEETVLIWVTPIIIGGE